MWDFIHVHLKYGNGIRDGGRDDRVNNFDMPAANTPL